jgi:hypothetical protein
MTKDVTTAKRFFRQAMRHEAMGHADFANILEIGLIYFVAWLFGFQYVSFLVVGGWLMCSHYFHKFMARILRDAAVSLYQGKEVRASEAVWL